MQNKDMQDKAAKYLNLPIMIGNQEDYLDILKRESTQLSLIAKKDNIEVIQQIIAPDKVFMLKTEEDSFEFYYILEGEIQNQTTHRVLTAGNFITVQGEIEGEYFKTLTQCKLLLFSTNPIFDSLQKQFTELIALNEQVKTKDKQTDSHCTRLQNLSLKTAEIMKLSNRKLFTLGYASFLHDIGKIEIDPRILTKPGDLNKEEWEEMKTHSSKGREIILEYLKEGFFKEVAEIVHQHHEKYDGSGYPRRLSGNDIMIEAQILSVVDAYDAMTSERPYQKARSRVEALEEIERCSGSHFSPPVVKAFIKAENELYQENNL
ncbi:MAG: HD-GYP domain-containing protein [Bacillota bacterium]